MAIKRSTGLRNAALSAGYASQFNTTGRMLIYTGAQPATADTAPTGTLLATLTLAATAFTVSGTTLVLGTVTSGTAVATGTAGYARLQLSADAGTTNTTDKRMDLLVGTDIAIDNASIVSGGTVACSGWTYNEAA